MSDAPPDPWIGRLVGGRFRITTKLGSGGWAVVYRARDEQADLGDVALKIPTVSREESLKLFAEEGRQLRKVEHPHVVPVYDVVKATEDDPRPVLVLGLMRGSLEKVLDEAPGRLQSPAMVAAWLTPVAGALDYLHLQLKKVHRDVKPANILFDGAGQPRLSDFGIVFSLAPGSRTRKLGQDSSLGTPIYMAPELLLSAVEPSATSDQYALACTAFEALSARLPFPVPDVGDDARFQILWARAVELNEPTPLAKTAPHVPGPAAAAIDRALSKDPAKRFASCEALADAFREGLRPPPVPPEPPEPPHEESEVEDASGGRTWRRRAIVGSIAAIGIGVLLWAGLRKTPSNDSAATTPPPPTEITLVVDEPANGDVVGARDVRVTGRATGPADLIVRVNGVEATQTGSRFEGIAHARDDGLLPIHVTAHASGPADREEARGVEVDTEAPVIEITDPAGETSSLPSTQATAVIRGRVRDLHVKEILVDGKDVHPRDGSFDTTVAVAEGATLRVEVVATDAAGNRATKGRTISRAKAPPPAPYEAYLKSFAVVLGTEIDAATGYPKRIRRLKDDAEMVLIPAGTFQMGAVSSDQDARDDEKPRHAVTLTKAYYLDVNEVTNAQFQTFVAATSHRTTADEQGDGYATKADGSGWEATKGATWRAPLAGGGRPSGWERHPVVLVSHDDATAFARWAGAALPTEAQFERAERGGDEGRVFPWGDSLPAPSGFGNYAGAEVKRALPKWPFSIMDGYEDGFAQTAPVRSFRPNGFGAYDLSGNVWEWCSDWYDKAYYAVSPSRDPSGPGSGSTRAARGGSWYYGGDLLRASYRFDDDPAIRGDCLGFRLARSL